MSPESLQPVAVVTGASSGIGEATAKTLAGLGFHVVCLARREDRIKSLAAEIGGTAIVADVTDGPAIDALAASLERVDVLVNNAGGAKGVQSVADADLDDWRWMWETNVLGTLRVTQGTAAQADRVRRRPDRHGDFYCGPSRSTTAGRATPRPSMPRRALHQHAARRTVG